MCEMNDFSNIPSESEIRDTARLTPEEAWESTFEDERPYDGGGWPGDGSGTDDLADLMAHGDEGCCDTGNDY